MRRRADVHRRAQRVVARIERQTAAGSERHIERAERRAGLVALELAEEHVRRIVPHDFVGTFGIGLEPGRERTERHLVCREQGLFDQVAADGFVGVPVLAVVVHANGGPVGKLDAARTLDLHEKDVDGIGEIKKLQALALECALIDLRAGEIRFVAFVGLAYVRQGAGLDGAAVGLGDDRDEVGGALVDRGLVRPLRRARCLEHRLVVARQQAGLDVVFNRTRREAAARRRRARCPCS